jgi:hypothetical protein
MNAIDGSETREKTVHVFVSYAREDKRWLDPEYRCNLIPFLAESLRRYDVVFWYDSELKPGDVFKRQIEAEIDQAQIALLIVSQSFLNSEFIEQVEMPLIAERARRGETIVIPVLVEPCDWSDYPFLADRQMVPSANPLIDFTESEAKWAKVKFQILDGLKAQIMRIQEAPQSAAQASHGSDAHGTVFAERASSSAAISSDRESDAGRLAKRALGVESAVPSRRMRIPVWVWGVGAVLVLALCFMLLREHFGSHETSAAMRSGTTVRLTSVFGTSDGKKLWAAGDGGALIESDDGGITWSPRVSGIKSHLESIYGTSDGMMLWAVGVGGAIIKSSDGGASWTQEKSGTTDTLLANFGTGDGACIWAVGDAGMIIASDDKGATWTTRKSRTANPLLSIFGTSDGARLWVVGDNGIVLSSNDGGKTWTS